MRVDDFFENDVSDTELIKELQTLLRRKGAKIEVTGKLDSATAEAVKTYYPHLYDKIAPDSDQRRPSKSLDVGSERHTSRKPTDPESDKPAASAPAKRSSSTGSAFRDPEFVKKLKTVAQNLRIDPDDLAAIIYTESRGRASAINKFDVSVGLIGFTRGTAESLKTTKERIAQMSAIDQLDLVEQYYRRIGVKPGMNRGQIYMLTFLPAFVNSPDNTVLGKENGGNLVLPSGRESKLSMHKIWFQNPMFGKSRNQSYFTVGDVKRAIMSAPVPSLAEGISEDDVNPVDTVELDVPLLLRMMEYAREDAKTDMDLHDVTEKMIHLSKTGETLSMAQYDDIVGDSDEPVQEPTPEQPAQQEAIGGASAEEFLKSVEYKPHHPAKPKRSLMGKPMREGHGRYWCSTDKRWKERQGPKQSRG